MAISGKNGRWNQTLKKRTLLGNSQSTKKNITFTPRTATRYIPRPINEYLFCELHF